MTSADHRRLTPWLLAIVAIQLAAVAFQILGPGPEPVWLAPLPPAEASVGHSAPAPPTLPLHAYANTWERPLFNMRRQPDNPSVSGGAPASLQGLVLTGSIITDTLRVALLKDPNGKAVSIAQGKALPGGWLLEHVDATGAVFVSGERQLRLPLRKDGQAATAVQQP